MIPPSVIAVSSVVFAADAVKLSNFFGEEEL